MTSDDVPTVFAGPPSRRTALVVCGVLVGLVCLVVGAEHAPSVVAAQPSTVRLALVNVPDEVLRSLLPVFREQHRHSAVISYTGNDPFSEGRAGRADLVIAHFGHAGVEPFITAGLGLWPKAVFANQMALIGPSSDPAGVRGVRSLSEAFRRIAAAKSRYVANVSAGATYLEEIATSGMSSGRPVSLGPGGFENAAAVRFAAERGAYVIWGVPPFLRWKRQQSVEQATDLEPLVIDDPTMHRIMVAIVVNPSAVKEANSVAATAFQSFLLSPATQARIAAFRYPDFDQQVWWPAGRHTSARD